MVKLIRTSQVAQQLGVHRSQIHRWVASGQLQPTQVVELGGTAEAPKVAYLFDADYIAELNPFRIRRRAQQPQTGTDP